jgi:hypothetical protein
MVLLVHGFPTQVLALQFEWAWQHPERSLEVRATAAKLGRKARYGVGGKVCEQSLTVTATTGRQQQWACPTRAGT